MCVGVPNEAPDYLSHGLALLFRQFLKSCPILGFKRQIGLRLALSVLSHLFGFELLLYLRNVVFHLFESARNH